MTDREERIRELAYFLWLKEGCPEDAAERRWLAAETVVEPDERKRIECEPPGEPANNSVNNGDGGIIRASKRF